MLFDSKTEFGVIDEIDPIRIIFLGLSYIYFSRYRRNVE